MHLTEIPLLLFTVLGQMSAGAFIILGAIRIFAAPAWGFERVERLSDIALLAIGPTLALGFAASFLHLGNPVNAANALNHVASSGMSREILTGVLFAAVGAVYAACQYFRVGSALVRHILATVTAVLGFVLVWMMASLYVLPTVPAWNTWITPARFFTTTVLLGAMAIAVALTFKVKYPNLRVPGSKSPHGPVDENEQRLDEVLVVQTLTRLSALTFAGLALTVVLSTVHLSSLAHSDDPAAATSLGVLTEAGGAWLAARIGLTLLGVLVLGAHLFFLRGNRARAHGEPGTPGDSHRTLALTIVILAFALIFVGEVIGREMFYAMYARVGL